MHVKRRNRKPYLHKLNQWATLSVVLLHIINYTVSRQKLSRATWICRSPEVRGTNRV